MRRAWVRVVLLAYWRRMGSLGRLPSPQSTPWVLPAAAGDVEVPSVLTVAATRECATAVLALHNVEDSAAFVSIAVHHYFRAVARGGVGDPFSRVCGRPTLGLLPDIAVQSLLSLPSMAVSADPEPVSMSGQWLVFAGQTGWQPGILATDVGSLFDFGAARGRIVGQARATRVMSGYYLQVLQSRFRCRVGLHVQCMPQLRRGDAAVVRMMMARGRWPTFGGGRRESLSGALLSMLLCLRSCDARGLARVLRFLLVCAGYFRHRALLMFLQRFVAVALDLAGMSSDLQGVLLQLRGKIGRRGLARKSKYVISCGAVRPVTCQQHILGDYTQVTTITGVLGLNIALVF